MSLLLLLLSLFQYSIPGSTGARGSAAGPAFVTSTYVAETCSTSCASITSPAVSLSSGQFAYVFCRSGGGTSITVTSSPANTFTQLAVQGSNPVIQGSYAMNTGSGSTTFTCAPSSSEQYQSMVVLVYSGVATTSALDTQTGLTQAGGSATFTSGAFTTATAVDVIIFCGAANGDYTTWTAGAIGTPTATMRQSSAANFSTTADSACEDLVTSTTQSAITAAMSLPTHTSQSWAGTVGAFK
jgi:hypothetical protein